MARITKNCFRGMDINGEWHVGSLYEGVDDEQNEYCIILKDKHFSCADMGDEIAIAFSFDEIGVVIPETVSRFIGVLDASKTPIFANDILRPNGTDGTRYLVTYDEDECSFMAVALADKTMEPSGERIHMTRAWVNDNCQKVCERMCNISLDKIIDDE